MKVSQLIVGFFPLQSGEPQLIDLIDEVVLLLLQGPRLRVPLLEVHPQQLASDDVHARPGGVTSRLGSEATEAGSAS